MEDEVKLPTQPGAPTSEHGQMMYALGLINGTLKGIQARQDVTNGKVLKAADDIKELQSWQATTAGASITWTKIGTFLTVLIAAIALIVKLIK